MALAVKKMTDLELEGKRVLIREDLNVPIKDGKVTSAARLEAAVPTLRIALERGARVMVMSHLGRPKEGVFDPAHSLAPVAESLGRLLGRRIPLVRDWLAGVDVKPGDVVLFENVRFEKGEEADDEGLAKRMAALCDVFVMDAFGTAHRAQASTNGVARYAPIACAGPLLVAELEALGSALDDPARPLTAIVGGAKVSTKLEVLRTLAKKVDELILGGGIANTVLAAAGVNVGKSLAERDMIEFARELIGGEFGRAKIPLPTDVVVAQNLEPGAKGTVKDVRALAAADMILDIGPQTAARSMRSISPARARSSGTGRSACSSIQSSRTARAAWPKRWQRATRSRSRAAATLWRPSSSSASASGSPTSRRAAARSWSSWKARSCPQSRRWRNGPARHARETTPVLQRRAALLEGRIRSGARRRATGRLPAAGARGDPGAWSGASARRR